MSRKFKIFLLVALLMFLGFLREYIFVGINAVLYNKYFNTNEYDILSEGYLMRFLEPFSYRTLYISKWFITLLFVFLFWFVQKKFIGFLFPKKKPNHWLGMLYLSLLLLAGISFGTGYLIGHINEGYRFSRIFIGLAESPVPCMILIPLIYFYNNYNTET